MIKCSLLVAGRLVLFLALHPWCPVLLSQEPGTKTPLETRTKGEEAFLRGDYKAAYSLLKHEIESGRDTGQHRLLLGRCAIEIGELKEAESQAEIVLKADSRSVPAGELLARALFMQARWAESAKAYAEVVKVKPSAVVLSELGQALFHLGSFVEAENYLSLAAAEEPPNPTNYYYLGLINLAGQLGASAEKNLLRAYDLGMTNPEMHVLLAGAYDMQGKLTGPIVQRHLGVENAAKGALIDDVVVLEKTPGMSGTYLTCDFCSALYHSLSFLQHAAQDVDMLLVSARAWTSLGETELAQACLDRIPAESGTIAAVILVKAELLAQKNSFQELMGMVVDGVSNQKLSIDQAARLLEHGAWRAISAQENERAIKMLEKSLELRPESPTCLHVLARLYESSNEKQKAIEYYRLFLQLHPDSALAEQIRARLAAVGAGKD